MNFLLAWVSSSVIPHDKTECWSDDGLYGSGFSGNPSFSHSSLHWWLTCSNSCHLRRSHFEWQIAPLSCTDQANLLVKCFHYFRCSLVTREVRSPLLGKPGELDLEEFHDVLATKLWPSWRLAALNHTFALNSARSFADWHSQYRCVLVTAASETGDVWGIRNWQTTTHSVVYLINEQSKMKTQKLDIDVVTRIMQYC